MNDDNADIKTILGESVRKRRTAHGLTQVALAERAGVTRNTIQEIESGTASTGVEILAAVARAFGLQPSQLLATDTTEKEYIGYLRNACDSLPEDIVRPLWLTAAAIVMHLDAQRRAQT